MCHRVCISSLYAYLFKTNDNLAGTAGAGSERYARRSGFPVMSEKPQARAGTIVCERASVWLSFDPGPCRSISGIQSARGACGSGVAQTGTYNTQAGA